MGKKPGAKVEKRSQNSAVRLDGPPCKHCGAPSRRVRPQLYKCERGHGFTHKWR